MKYNWNNKTVKKVDGIFFSCPHDCVFIDNICSKLPIECDNKDYYEYDEELSIFYL